MIPIPANPLQPYAAILFVIALAIAMAGSILILTHVVGGRRLFRGGSKGLVKDSTYESGVPPVGDARRQFNVRFYVVAILFLLFDVEVLFLWPWAPVFYKSATAASTTVVMNGVELSKGFLLMGMGLFLVLLLVGFVYEWRKGALQWD